MTRLRILEHHRRTLSDIRNIMNSMKTLAYMETRKLMRFLEAQHAVIKNIEEAAMDLLSFYPETLPEEHETTPAYILIGTERGFCGDFNHALIQHLDSTLQINSSNSPLLIAVGRKLHTLMEDYELPISFVNGVNVVEEITSLLNKMVIELTTLQRQYGALTVYCLYHGSEKGVVMQMLLPSLQNFLPASQQFPYPPVLNQSPRDFLVSLTDHYLFALLYEILYTSLMAENHLRVAHLEGAVKHLDDKEAELSRQCNTLRQEEIIEEIEVILLNTSGFGKEPKMRYKPILQTESKNS